VITESPKSPKVDEGNTVTLTVAVTTPVGCKAPTVQWQSRSPGATAFKPIAGADALLYTVTATAELSETEYEAVLTSAAGTSVTSGVATLLVLEGPGDGGGG
jgi:hypothetical protein